MFIPADLKSGAYHLKLESNGVKKNCTYLSKNKKTCVLLPYNILSFYPSKSKQMDNKAIKGGNSIIRDVNTNDISPQKNGLKSNMIKLKCVMTLSYKVIPNLDRIDSMEEELMAKYYGKS